MLLYIVFLLLFLNVECFTPNCVPGNQFKFYRFPVQGCSEIFQERCKFHPSGYFKALGDTSLVKIGETEVLPTCAFYNADGLKRIYGVNSKIKVLATRAFTNLPNLESIHLAFNFITEVRKDVFKNVSVKMLDLSWNKIVFIDTHAFAEIRSLKNLNLTKNSLVTVPINYLPNTLTHINLGHNFLERIALNSDKFLNLTVVDLSNNLIEKIAMYFSYPVEQIDLGNNRLRNFDYIEMSSVKMFRIGGNQFENMPEYLENLNAKEIDLYPNPWKCDQLFLLWEILVSFNIRLAPRETGKNPPAECFKTGGRLGVTVTRSNPCLEDHECPDYMACRTNKCWDPCENSLCHTSSFCEAKNHRFVCSCDNNLLSDPLDVYGKCQRVDCFININCPSGMICWSSKCERESMFFDSESRPSGGHDSLSFRPEAIMPIAEHIPYREEPFSTTSHSDSHNKELPWWYEDIPRVTTSTPAI